MNWFAPDYLLYGSIVIYLAAAIAAIVFYRQHRVCTLLAQSGCVLASLCGAAFSLWKLLSGGETLVLDPLRSAIPFLSLHIAIDALSAFFILVL